MGSLVRIEYAAPVASESTSLIVAAAESLDVVDQSTYALAGETLMQCKTEIGVVNAEEEKIVPPLHQAHKAAKALFNKLRAPFEQAEFMLKTKMVNYTREQQRIADARQQAANAAAAAERERLDAEAAAALASGDVAKAESLATVAEVVQAPTVVSSVQKIAGISTRKAWKIEITDKVAFVAAAATNPAFLAAIGIDEYMLAKLANATDGKMVIPGVRAYQVDVMSARKVA